jgi:O-antigen/teichoic acid export membrane protein
MPGFLNLNLWKKNKSVQNFLFLSIIQASNILISIITIPIIVSAVDIEQFGLISLSLSIITLVNVGVNYGFHLSGPREVALIADDPHKLSALYSRNLFSRIFLAAFFTLSLLIIISNTNAFDRYAIILAYSTILLFSEALFPSWFAQGMQRMSIISIGNLISKLLYLFFLIVFVNQPNDSKWVNFFSGTTALVINVVLVFIILFKWKIRIQINAISKLWESIRSNFILFLSAFISHISISSGVIILSFFASNKEIGLYSLAERIMFVLRMFPVLIIQSIYPNASKFYKDDVNHFYQFLRKIYLRTIAITLLISFGAFLLAPWIINLLSGEYRDGSIYILRILAFIPFLSSLNVANMIIILVSSSNKLLFKGTWIVAGFLLISGSILSFMNGGPGLAYALLLTELFIFIVYTILNLKHLSVETNKFYAFTFSSHYCS